MTRRARALGTRLMRYVAALEQSTIGGDWTRNDGLGPDRRKSLCQVRVPPSKARDWVLTWAPPPRGRPLQAPEPPGNHLVQSQHIGETKISFEWGNGGVYAYCECDWGQGGTVNLFGSDLRAYVQFPIEDEFSLNVPEGLRLQSLNAWFAPGSSRNPVPPTHTVYINGVAGTGGIGDAAVPPWAKGWRVYVANSLPFVTVTFRNRAGILAVGQFQTAGGAGAQFSQMDLHGIVPADATTIMVTNNEGTQRDFRVQFDLCV